MIFHGVIGKDEREANSPSYFNSNEIDVVIGYVNDILKSEIEEDICILTPYRKQQEKF